MRIGSNADAIAPASLPASSIGWASRRDGERDQEHGQSVAEE